MQACVRAVLCGAALMVAGASGSGWAEATDPTIQPEAIFTTPQPGTGNLMLTGPKLIQALSGMGYDPGLCTTRCQVVLQPAGGGSPYMAGWVLADGTVSPSRPGFRPAVLAGASISVNQGGTSYRLPEGPGTGAAQRCLSGPVVAGDIAEAKRLIDAAAGGQPQPAPLVWMMPKPAYAVANAPAAAPFVFSNATVFAAAGGDQPVARSVNYLANTLRKSAGIDILANADTRPGTSCVALQISGELPSTIGDEGYVLVARTNRIWIGARTEAGLFAGVQSLLQLLPAAVYSPAPQQAAWSVPPVSIADWPRFAYRGMMLDVARRFYPVEDVKRAIDQAAQLKINTIRLHITDDQGWRIPIAGLPALTDIGGTTQSGFPSLPENRWFYTRDQYADITAYARARFIEVIPEIEGPGHSAAALASIPGLNCNNQARAPYSGFDVRISALCMDDQHVGNVRSYLETVMADVARQTPGRYVHVGGDEVPASLGLQRYNTYMNMAVGELARAGKTAMGWHELASADIPAGTLLQYWGTEAERAKIGTASEGTEIGLVRQGLAKGGRFVISPADRSYLDMKYSSSTPYGLSWAGLVSIQRSYSWDPVQTLSSPDGRIAILKESDIAGVEGALWADRAYTGSTSLPTPSTVWPSPRDYTDYMAFPRLAAVAEIGWSTAGAGDWAEFRSRLGYQGPRWDAYGTKFFRSTEIVWR